MLEAQSLGLDKPSTYTVTVRPANAMPTGRSPQKRRTSSGVSASDFQELMDMSEADLREIGEEIIQHLPDFRSPEKLTPEYSQPSHQYPQQNQPTPEAESYMDPVQEVVASMRAAAAQKQIQEREQKQMEQGTSSQYSTGHQQQTHSQGQSNQYYQTTYAQQLPVTTASVQIRQEEQQLISSSAYPAHHHLQPKSCQPPQPTPLSTSSPMPVQQQHFGSAPPSVLPQQPVQEDKQRYEQEDGLDAEYAMRQQADQTPIVTNPIEKELNTLSKEEEGQKKDSEMVSEEQNKEIVDDPQKDKELDEYLIVQTKNSWEPPIVVNVPVSNNGRAKFSQAQIGIDREVGKLEKSKTSNEDNFVGQLDDEPIAQQSKQPFNPILVKENGQPVETKSTDGQKSKNGLKGKRKGKKLTDKQVDQMLEVKESELKSKADESSDNGSEDSFEYLTMDNDEFDDKKNKRVEIEQKLQQQVKGWYFLRNLMIVFIVKIGNLLIYLDFIEKKSE